MPYAALNDLRLYYEERGRGEPLILLHGALGVVDPASRAGWAALLPDLSARFRTFSLEHRGHGRTNNPTGRLTYAALAGDLAAAIERFDLAPAHVAGVSQGGETALLLAMTRPELMRSLICVGADAWLDDRGREAMAGFSPDALERDLPSFAADLARRHDPHHGPGYWRDLVNQVRIAAETELVWTERDLARIPIPTLLIVGESDFAVSLEQAVAMRRSIPRAELLIVNHGGLDELANHLVQATRPEVVGPVILDFLARHSRGAI